MRPAPWLSVNTAPGSRGAQGRHGVHTPKDTEALICDLKVPEVYPQVVGRHVGLVVAVDGYGVDVVRVRVGKHPAGGGLHHQVHGPQHRHLQGTGSQQWARDAGSHVGQHRSIVCFGRQQCQSGALLQQRFLLWPNNSKTSPILSLRNVKFLPRC